MTTPHKFTRLEVDLIEELLARTGESKFSPRPPRALIDLGIIRKRETGDYYFCDFNKLAAIKKEVQDGKE